MAFSVSPATVTAPGSVTASGTGTKKRPAKIFVDETQVASFTMPGNGRFQRTLAISGPARTAQVVLKQFRTDNVWAQTASVPLLILAAGQGGGGTTPAPNPPPPPTPDITAPTVSGVSVTGISTTGATISWTTNEAATGVVEYGTTTAYGSQTAATSSGTTHQRTLSGLTPGQQYHYRIRATDTAGNLRLDTDRTVTTSQSPTLPGAPTGLTATGGNGQVVLAWTAPSSNGGSAITGYQIYRNGSALAVDAASPYTDSAVVNGTQYTYTVAAITAVGTGPQSGSATATPAAAGDINPPVISNVQITAITQTTATVSWSLNEPGTGQVFYGNDQGNLNNSTTLESSLLLAHSQNLTGLSPATPVFLQVRSRDAAGNLAISSTRTFTTAAVSPPPPTGTLPPETTLQAVAQNSDARPGYLAEITDSTWGTRIRRISNVDQTKPDYPRHQLWNLPQTRMILFRNNSGWRLIDAVSYADLNQSLNGVEYPVWSNQNGNRLYGCSQGQGVVKRYDLTATGWVTHMTTVYGHLSWGDGEGNVSDNDRAALIYNTTSGMSGTWGVVVVDLIAGTVISSLAIGTGSGNHPNNTAISRSGDYVVVEHGTQGSGNSQGTQLYTASNMTRVRQIVTSVPHADFGRNAAGEEIFVHMEGAGGVTSHRLSDGLSIDLFPAGGGVMDGGHVGCPYELNGYALLSSNSYSPSSKGNNQVVLAKTDGSGTVRVFGFHHAENAVTHQQYDYAPHACINRKGDVAAFGSVWSSSGVDSMYAYVARA